MQTVNGDKIMSKWDEKANSELNVEVKEELRNVLKIVNWFTCLSVLSLQLTNQTVHVLQA